MPDVAIVVPTTGRDSLRDLLAALAREAGLASEVVVVDDPRDALECFGSAPVDALAIGPFVVYRPAPERRLTDAARLAA